MRGVRITSDRNSGSTPARRCNGQKRSLQLSSLGVMAELQLVPVSGWGLDLNVFDSFSVVSKIYKRVAIAIAVLLKALAT